MDENAVEMYLQNLEEFVLDEDKIVTYKWLSKTLDIHVNAAKQLLYTFSSQKDKQNLVSATYLLGGKLRSSGDSYITVVGQDKYDQMKKLFESLSSDHVYSVQKAKHTPIPGTLFTVNSQPIDGKEEVSCGMGAIRCKESIRRATDELALLRISLAPTPSASAASKPPKATTSVSKESEKVSPSKEKADKTSDTNGKELKDGKSKAKGGLAAMFAAQTVKASSKSASAPATAAKSNGKAKAGGISNFFNKVSKEEQAEKEVVKNEEALEDKMGKTQEKDVKINACEQPSKSSSPAAKAHVEKKSEPKTSSKQSRKQSTQKRSRTKDKKEDGKKRKRIVIQELDSSDDDMFADEGNASSREPSPEPVLEAKALESEEEDVIPPTPTHDSNGNGRCRRRRKVTKDKTFMDDGYIVTQKVTEYESYSESDPEVAEVKKIKEVEAPGANDKASSSTSSKIKTEKSKASSKKSSPATNKSPAKSKQQSLTSFFKKKE